MQAVTQLCDRAILLDGGRIVDEGGSSAVVARYLQSGLGIGSSQEWPDAETAPGNDLVRLRSLRVVQKGDEAAVVDVREPVGIEVGFEVLKRGQPVFPKIKVYDPQSVVAFNAMDTSSKWDEPADPGTYVSTAWIPGNLLNEGLVTVWAQIASLTQPKLHTHAGGGVAFHVQDLGEGDSARGRYLGEWQGVVRPLLEWTTEER
jgi:lipopolysaccharide transport system ATP-binding protein